jgi:magnesium chelatase family protein
MLVGAMNPCPCGNLGDPAAICVCTGSAIQRYAKKVSGPLLDRMDIHIHVAREKVSGETHQALDIQTTRKAIAEARQRQQERFVGSGLISNSEISHRNIDTLCQLEPSAEQLLVSVVNQKSLSLRSYHKIKKIARTIADLAGEEKIGESHLAEALALRISDMHVVNN